MSEQFSADFSALFAWDKNNAEQPGERKPAKKRQHFDKDKLILAAEMLDKTGVGIKQITKIGAVEMLRRINNFNSNNRLQYD